MATIEVLARLDGMSWRSVIQSMNWHYRHPYRKIEGLAAEFFDKLPSKEKWQLLREKVNRRRNELKIEARAYRHSDEAAKAAAARASRREWSRQYMREYRAGVRRRRCSA